MINIYIISFLKVNGGSDISIRVRWSQKLIYKDDQFFVTIPFNFPEYVTPLAKIVTKKEKIQLNVNSGTGKEVVLQKSSRPLKVKICHMLVTCRGHENK